MTKIYVLPRNDGWLVVKPDSGGANFSIPEYLALDLIETRMDAGVKRDFFTILEGVHKGKNASVRWDVGRSNLSNSSLVYRPSAALVLDKSTMKLTYPGGTSTVADLGLSLGATPISNGVHPVQIPDFPHLGGQGYLAASPYAKCWFYLGVGAAVSGINDRYLHTGSASAGYITMHKTEWTKLYGAIISCRRGNNVDVGTIIVR
jgi:hypothetical protein